MFNKKLTLMIPLLFLVVSLFCQNTTFSTTYNISGQTSLVSGNTYTVTGTVTDYNNIYNGSSVAIGDSIFYIEEGRIYAGAITLINGSPSGNSVSFRFLSTEALLSTSPAGAMSGQVVISRKNPKGYCSVPSGCNEALRWALENRFKSKVAVDINNATEVYAYLGSSGVLPTTNPPTISQYLARNTANELYQWNGSAWVLVGSGAGAAAQATNGLTKTGDTIRLGGTLTQPTTITATLSNVLQIAGLKDNSNGNSTGNQSSNEYVLVKGGVGDTIYKVPSQYFLMYKDTAKFVLKNNISNQPTFTTIPITKTVGGSSNDSIAYINPSTGLVTMGDVNLIGKDFAVGSGLSGITTKEYYTNITDTTSSRKIANGVYELLEVKSYTPPKDTAIGSNTYKVTSNTRWYNTSLSVISGQSTEYKYIKNKGWQPSKPLSIIDFGGVGDSVTNNDAAYNKYKAYNIANGISEINIPDGMYIMTRWNVPANIKIIGNGTRTTILKSTTKGYMLYCGDSTYAYGIELRNFAINALNDSITAIRLINTAGASVSNIYIEGNLGSTNRTIGVEVAGGQNGNIFSRLNNIICNHIWKGYLFSRSSPTQTSTTMLSCSSLGDISSFPSIGSVGLEIQGANGQGSSIIGCNFESCDIGILNGGEQTFFSGNRFEGNNTDISNTSTSISNSYIGNQSLTSTKVSDLGTRNTFLSNTAFDTYQDIPNVLSGTLKVQLQAGTSTDSIVTATNGKLNRGVITDYAWSKLGNAGTNANTHFVGTTDNTQLTFRQNNTQRMFITSDGVGIGTGLTTNFGQSLAVQGNILLHNVNNTRGIVTSGDASNTGSIYIQSGGGSVGHGGGASFYAHSNVLYPGWTVANISSSSGTVGTATEGRFAVTNQGINVGAILFSVVRSGNVGINTTTPQYKLDIDAITGGTGNPIRALGLQQGSNSDSLISSANGILKRVASVGAITAGEGNSHSVNATIAAGANLSGGGTPFTVTVPGALVGDFIDFVVVPDDNDLTDIIIKAWVSATNIVSYQIENKRATSVVFTNKSVKARVRR